MDTFGAYKNKIGERVTRKLFESLKDGEVSEDQVSEISAYILDNIHATKDNVELFAFLENLAKKWPIFSSIIAADQEEKAVEEVSTLIKENKIDEAVKVAEQATAQDQSKN